MDKKSIVNDLYHASVVSALAIGYSMPGKKDKDTKNGITIDSKV